MLELIHDLNDPRRGTCRKHRGRQNVMVHHIKRLQAKYPNLGVGAGQQHFHGHRSMEA
jgi:hypothetical protein